MPSAKKNQRLKGQIFEWLALFFLLARGYRLLARQDRQGGIEADILMAQGNRLVVVEVKFRQSRAACHVAIHPAQQARLLLKARQLAAGRGFDEVRLDGVFFFPQWPFVEHVPNVFAG